MSDKNTPSILTQYAPQSNLSIQPINPCQSGSIWLNLGSIWGQSGVNMGYAEMSDKMDK